MSAAPRFEIDMQAFWRDPYPILARLRAEAPIAYVPQLRGIVFSRRDDIYRSEKNVEVFSSHQPEGLMNKMMGVNMMRKDGAAHRLERKAIFPTISPQTVRAVWTGRFQSHADRILDDLAPLGTADLCQAFALPFSGECLKAMTGLTNISYREMDAWSQAMIDGVANYSGDRDVVARCERATASIDAAIDARLPELTGKSDHSLISTMLQADLPLADLRANIKLAISGGQNEPRDAIAGLVWALLSHPEQLRKVEAGEVSWMQAFDEFNRWLSPIGMTPRRVAKPWSINGIDLQPEDQVFFMFSSANRDEAHFDAADQFDISRDTGKAIPFGAGPHFCAGAWASRAMIGEVALPTLFARLKALTLAPGEDVRIGGWAFRGVLNLPVTWQVGSES